MSDDAAARRATATGWGSPPPPSPNRLRSPIPTARADRVPPERISKVLAAAGIASRRGADELVTAGRVRVDGRLAVLGERVDPETQQIEVDRIALVDRHRAPDLPRAPQARRRDIHRPRPSRGDDRRRPRPAGARPRRPPVPRRPPRPGLRGADPAYQRRRLGGARAPPAVRRRARVRRRAHPDAQPRPGRGAGGRRGADGGCRDADRPARPDADRGPAAGRPARAAARSRARVGAVHDPPGLEAPAAADVRGCRRAGPAPGSRPDRDTPPRRARRRATFAS